MFLLRGFAVWLVMMAAETLHGTLRTLLLAPQIGDFPARQVGVPIGSLLIFGIAYLFVRWVRAVTTARLLAVGLEWVALTVLSEVALGRLALGLPWERLAEDYDPSRGGLMGLGLLVMAVSPLLAVKLRSRTEGTAARPAEPRGADR
jgi:apolipoprotein N-acyltransferase